MSASASWQRLPDDSWGLRIVGLPAPQPGAEVCVHKASGEESWEVVGEIMWTSGAVTVARYVQRQRSWIDLHPDDSVREDFDDD